MREDRDGKARAPHGGRPFHRASGREPERHVGHKLAGLGRRGPSSKSDGCTCVVRIRLVARLRAGRREVAPCNADMSKAPSSSSSRPRRPVRDDVSSGPCHSSAAPVVPPGPFHDVAGLTSHAPSDRLVREDLVCKLTSRRTFFRRLRIWYGSTLTAVASATFITTYSRPSLRPLMGGTIVVIAAILVLDGLVPGVLCAAPLETCTTLKRPGVLAVVGRVYPNSNG